jgi:hypothetical protein
VDLHSNCPARVVFYCAFESAVRRRFRRDGPVADEIDAFIAAAEKRAERLR